METTISKVVRIGSYSDSYYIKKLPVFCKIEYIDGKLSISGTIAPLPSGNAKGSCGQIYDTIAENLASFTFANGWDKVKASQFVEYWKKWHLNDMQAGCEHQRKMGWKDYEEHPSEPCPTCGYKYGTEWKTKKVPAEVLRWLEALPNTDKTPEWV